MDIHVPIRVLRFLQPYIEKLGPFVEDIIRLVEPFAPKLAQTLGMLSQLGIQGPSAVPLTEPNGLRGLCRF